MDGVPGDPEHPGLLNAQQAGGGKQPALDGGRTADGRTCCIAIVGALAVFAALAAMIRSRLRAAVVRV
jgi:hypothetical protein